jgi:hypothetical protein
VRLVGQSSAAGTFAMAVPPTKTADVLLTVAHGRHLAIFEALLPYDPYLPDLGWIRGPMIVACVVSVFLWQYYGKERVFGPSRRRGGKRGVDGDDAMEDAAAAVMGSRGSRTGRSFDIASASAKYRSKY